MREFVRRHARAPIKALLLCKEGFLALETGWQMKFSGAQGSLRERVPERSA